MQLESTMINDGLLKIDLKGRLDIAGAQEIDASFTDLIRGKGVNVIVDLSGVDFMASIGMRTIIAAAKSLSLRNARMALCCPQPMVGEVLQRMGIASLMPVTDDLDGAIAALTQA